MTLVLEPQLQRELIGKSRGKRETERMDDEIELGIVLEPRPHLEKNHDLPITTRSSAITPSASSIST